jgi:putative DNA primase/helicase
MNFADPIRQYLNLIHPQPGKVFVAMSHPAHGWVQRSADTPERIATLINKFEATQPTGIFVSQAVFDPTENSRTANLALTLASLFVDLDVGKGATKYPTKDAALSVALRLNDTFLPLTALVDSGGGYHAYWRFESPIPAAQWEPLAKQFKHALAAASVLADTTVTADAARVLRVPGTLNRKEPASRPCHFRTLDMAVQYSVADITNALQRYEQQPRPTDEPPPRPKPLAQVALLLGERPRVSISVSPLQHLSEMPPAPTQIEVERACPAVRALTETGGASEPAWSLGLINTAAFTADPESAAQAWSARHPGYQPSEVSDKLAAKQQSTNAPTTCTHMAALDAACAQACSGCQYLGQATTPIHAAQKLAGTRRGLALQHGVPALFTASPLTPDPELTFTETGNARRLHRALGSRVVWVHDLSTWLYFNGGTWHAITAVEMIALATPIMQKLYADAATTSSAAEAKALATHATKSLSSSALSNAVELFKSQPCVQIRATQLDANDMLLGTADGQVIDLTNGRSRAQLPADYITKSVACHFDPAAICPTWRAFLDSLFRGGPGATDEHDDQGRITYLQQWVGYALTGLTTEQQFQFAHGLGANGKSVLYGLLAILFASYGLQSSPDAFMLKTTGEGATPLLARLQGARLVIAPETEDGQRLAESTVKQLTGGDTIVARPLYGNPFEFKPKFKLAIVGNHKPLIRGDDHGIWRRVHLLPFTRIFEPQEQDTDLPNKLHKELPGILNWAIEGCLAWQRAGRLRLPAIMLREAQEYRTEMDLIAQWLADDCQIAPGLTTTGPNAYT